MRRNNSWQSIRVSQGIESDQFINDCLDDDPIGYPPNEAASETYSDPFYSKSSALLSDNLKEEEVESSFLSESSK